MTTMNNIPEDWNEEMWVQYKAFMGDVIYFWMAAQIYAEEMNISIEVANHAVGQDWSLKQAKAYVKSHKGQELNDSNGNA